MHSFCIRGATAKITLLPATFFSLGKLQIPGSSRGEWERRKAPSHNTSLPQRGYTVLASCRAGRFGKEAMGRSRDWAISLGCQVFDGLLSKQGFSFSPFNSSFPLTGVFKIATILRKNLKQNQRMLLGRKVNPILTSGPVRRLWSRGGSRGIRDASPRRVDQQLLSFS